MITLFPAVFNWLCGSNRDGIIGDDSLYQPESALVRFLVDFREQFL